MSVFLRTAAEYNEGGHLLYAIDFPGAYARARTREEALAKLPADIMQYCLWCGRNVPSGDSLISVTEEKESTLEIADADSDILLSSESGPLTEKSYEALRDLCLKSARDFLALYESIPDKEKSLGPERSTFYGSVPRTAKEMYTHTANVNAYYFGEIGIDAKNTPDIVTSRQDGFALLEQTADFLENRTLPGSYGELWSLKKMCRRFIWHDRIHAKAMYRRSCAVFGRDAVANPFFFTM